MWHVNKHNGCKDWRHSDKNCSLNLSQSCIAIVHI
ncbi:hypothetical protein AAZX31_10G074800 [Glycine max]